jgi:hypothetical protein
MNRVERNIETLCRFIIFVALSLPLYLGIEHGLLNLERNPVLQSALAGAFLIHMWIRPRAAEWTATVAMGLLGSAAYAYGHQGFGNYPGAVQSICASFAGLASLLTLAAQSLLGAPAHRAERRKTLWIAAAFPYLSFVMAFFLNLTTAQHPRVYDLWLYAFDESLKVRASFLIGHLIANAAPLQDAARMAYESLPLVICWLLAVELRSAEKFSVNVIRLFVTAGLAGILLYQFLPAVGPVYVFGKKFPESLPALTSIVIQPMLLPHANRNAMPSVHFACALLVWWNTAALGRVWRALAAGFSILIFLATIGFGEHYLVDLVVAFPFALAVQAACLKSARQSVGRRPMFWKSTLLTVAWIGALRSGLFPDSFALSWCAVIATVALTLWWKRGLDECLGQQYVEEIPDHQPGVPVVDPADQIGAAQGHANTRQANRQNLGGRDRKAGAEMQQRPDERAGLRDAKLESDQGGQKVQNLQV